MAAEPGDVDYKLVYTRKGSLALMVDGYAFSKVRNGEKGRVFWRCVKSSCKARLSTIDSEIKSYKKEHNHPTEAEEQQVCVCVCALCWCLSVQCGQC